MSKNVKVNGVDYTGVSQVQLPLTAGGTALFKDVDEITEGGGGFDIDTAETLLCTVETEDLIGNILAAHPIKPKYTAEVCIINIRGTNAPTQGAATLKRLVAFIKNGSASVEEWRMLNSLVPPDSISDLEAGGANAKSIAVLSGAYTNVTNGLLVISSNFSRYVAAGNTVSYYEVPLDLEVPTVDVALRAAE
jgi:hypothetical protein